MSGAVDVAAGNTSDQATSAALIAVETASTHVGTPTASFGFFFQGQSMFFPYNIPFIATPDLYAALNASSTAAALITWNS